MSRSQIAQMVRAPLAKIITRVVLYGFAMMFASAGISSGETSEPAAAIAEGLASVILIFIGGWIDKWHHNQDTNEGKFLQ